MDDSDGRNGHQSRRRRIAQLLARNPIPLPSPETEHFWQGTRQRELRLQRCAHCRHIYFPPRPFCPKCHSRHVEIFRASGYARLYSYVINHVPPASWPQHPQSLALVELEEGPRMTSTIINVAQTPEALQLDMLLRVTFKPLSDTIWLPVFEPVEHV